MQLITGLLERYKNFVPPRLAATRALRTAIQEVVGVEVEERGITLQNGRAFIKSDGLQKTEILLHREAILASLHARIGQSISDIH